jgi:methionine-rich copper-binding protein CopC
MLPIVMLSLVLVTACKKDTEVVTDPTLETTTDLLTNKSGGGATVSPTNPADGATEVPLDQVITVYFNDGISHEQIAKTTITLKKLTNGESGEGDGDDGEGHHGDQTVKGTLSYTNSTASFTPNRNLAENTNYKATVITKSHDQHGHDHDNNGYSWRFSTGSGVNSLVPSVTLTDPMNNSTGVAFNKAVVVTFSEAMDPLTINTSTFSLKQGSSVISGIVSYTGTKATFTPASNLAPNQIYTGTITTGVTNLAGVALISVYTFSFTTGATADITAPTVTSTDPQNNAIDVAINKVVGLTFSEAMNPSTISTSTFTVKQGSTAITGIVAYSGTTATFTPSNAFAAGTVYTATITTGAKDLAGNALASSIAWSFTTAASATPPGLSFANDVMPVLSACDNCHNHNWTPSTVASTFYTNLVNSNYVKPADYTTSKIYTKMLAGHPGSGSMPASETDKIINWMIEGSLNN